MPFPANDRLDLKLSHGDLSIIFEAGHNDTGSSRCAADAPHPVTCCGGWSMVTPGDRGGRTGSHDATKPVKFKDGTPNSVGQRPDGSL